MHWTLRDGCGLDDVLIQLAKGRDVFAPVEGENGNYSLSKSDGWRRGVNTLAPYRQTEPLKALFFPAREYIGRWKDVSLRSPMPKRIVFGVKNCDLSSLGIFDHVFLHGVAEDPYYAEARRNTVLVSSDCSSHRDVCFCPAVGEQPWPKAGFDINIAETPDGVLLEDGSSQGAMLLESAGDLLKPAEDALVERVKSQREKHYQDLAEDCSARGLKPGSKLQEAIEGAFGDGLWARYAEHCVECGACNFVCCTCHCFLLADGMDENGEAARTKLWDACLYDGFARTAGGGTPRPYRAERLRNRFDKKFSYFPQVMGRFACDGCGRCTEACIANIDIRDVLKDAMEAAAVA
ncbi:MAG: 4Fe-4S dicluster domain-containing protein [Xanthomonadales bacterium]|jgi:hypothetical protein|nr:4Fe-4S dicluster domain-containing protein [Xanthomonadales bacterium]